MESLLLFVALLIIGVLALYWIVRLAVRHAILDARSQPEGADGSRPTARQG